MEASSSRSFRPSNRRDTFAMARPYLYHYAATFPRSEDHSRSIAWKEVQKAGFTTSSKYMDWHYFFVNADTLVVVSNVPVSESETHVHVVATSNTDAPAKKWASTVFDKIKNSKLVAID
jgi:hypothetical protein